MYSMGGKIRIPLGRVEWVSVRDADIATYFLRWILAPVPAQNIRTKLHSSLTCVDYLARMVEPSMKYVPVVLLDYYVGECRVISVVQISSCRGGRHEGRTGMQTKGPPAKLLL